MDPQTNPLRKRIKGAQTYDTEVSQALESVLRNGPRSVYMRTRRLEPRRWTHLTSRTHIRAKGR
jgi:hypothetical protein